MSAPHEDLATAVGQETTAELVGALQKIQHCLKQLTDEQIWWRPSASMNSIGNLILHLCGNLRQWIVAGVGGSADTRNRPQEFAQRDPVQSAELLQQLEDVVQEARIAMTGVSSAELLRVRRIQGFDVTALQAIVESTAHFRGHTQEIVHMTRCQLGSAYEFDFVPQTREQGAASEPL